MLHFRLLYPAAFALSVLLCAGRTQAQTTIDYFNFNNGYASGSGAPTSISHSSNQGGGMGRGALYTNFTASNLIYTGGTTTNAQNGDGAGNALTLQGGTSSNNKYLLLTTNTLGYKNLVLSFATSGNSTEFNSNQLLYSLDGSNYTNFSTAYDPATSFSTQRFDLTSVTAINNQSLIYLKITFSGATDTTGTNTIDNFLLTGTATPAPAGVVSMGIGLGMAGLGAWRRRRRQARQKAAVSSLLE